MTAIAAWVLVSLLLVAGCTAPPVKQPDASASNTKGAPKTSTAPSRVRAPDVMPAEKPVEPGLSLGVQELVKGIKSYEDGDYRAAARQLEAALNFGLSAHTDQAKAHKYLAFINCASSRDRACRDEFSKALGADPKFDLEPAEAGHPIWGPVYRAVKAEAAKPPGK